MIVFFCALGTNLSIDLRWAVKQEKWLYLQEDIFFQANKFKTPDNVIYKKHAKSQPMSKHGPSGNFFILEQQKLKIR